MSIKLTVGGRDPFDITSLKDLKSDADTLMHLGNEFQDWLDKPISALPALLRSTGIAYDSGTQSWAPGQLTFTLCGGVTGKIDVLTSGNILTYTDDFPTEVTVGLSTTDNKKNTKPIAVPDGAAYVCVELDFQIGGGIAANFTQGVYGVCASVSTKDALAVRFCMLCKPTDNLGGALQAAMAGYVLPLHAGTYAALEDGDYLHHTFNANVQLGLGASVGLNHVFYAGQYTADIPDTAGAVSVTASVSPAVKAGAKLAFAFDYDGTFEALLWKAPDGTGRLHLYRAVEQDKSLTLTLGVTLCTGAAASTGVVADQLSGLFQKSLPGKLGAIVSDKSAGAIGDFSSDVNDKVSALLAKVGSTKAELDIAIQTTTQNFLLVDYTFDLGATAFSTAWGDAVQGRFLNALAVVDGGVSLGIGSGLERLYSKKTSVTLNLFGLLKAAWTDAVIDNTSMVYKGNNTFHLIADEGRQSLSSIGKSSQEIDLYFAAEADLTGANLALRTINLHLMLKAVNDGTFGLYIANFLSLLTMAVNAGEMDTSALVESLKALAAKPGTTEELHVVLPPGAYGRLHSSTIVKGKPDDQSTDQMNYIAFSEACSELFDHSPVNFSVGGQRLGYGMWSEWNIACTDEWPPSDGAVPDRLTPGNLDAGADRMSAVYPQANGHQIGDVLVAASNFMNFCEALKGLAKASVVDLAQWNQLVGQLKSIMENALSGYFLAPTGLALVGLCSSATPNEVVGPLAGNAKSIAVTMTYL